MYLGLSIQISDTICSKTFTGPTARPIMHAHFSLWARFMYAQPFQGSLKPHFNQRSCTHQITLVGRSLPRMRSGALHLTEEAWTYDRLRVPGHEELSSHHVCGPAPTSSGFLRISQVASCHLNLVEIDNSLFRWTSAIKRVVRVPWCKIGYPGASPFQRYRHQSPYRSFDR